MRKLRDSLIQLFQASWGDNVPSGRIKALVIEQAEQLLLDAAAPVGLRCKILSHGTLHRHIMVVHCPDQAFYPDAIRTYLQKQHIQPIEQASVLFSVPKNLEEGVSSGMDGQHKALFLVFHLSVTTTKNIIQVDKDIQHILQAVHQSVVDFPAMRSELERASF